MIAYRKGYKYQLARDYFCQICIYPEKDIVSDFIFLRKSGLLLTRNGYAWNGPSGPTIDTKNFMQGSLVHDALYQLMREEKLSQACKLIADKELRRICIEDGMSRVRAWWVFRGVSTFGGDNTLPENRKIILTAP